MKVKPSTNRTVVSVVLIAYFLLISVARQHGCIESSSMTDSHCLIRLNVVFSKGCFHLMP